MASPKFRFGEHLAEIYSSKTFEKILKFDKTNLHEKLKKFSKIFLK